MIWYLTSQREDFGSALLISVHYFNVSLINPNIESIDCWSFEISQLAVSVNHIKVKFEIEFWNGYSPEYWV